MNLLTELSEKQNFCLFCQRSFSCFCCSDSFSSPVVSSGPRTACLGLCVEPNEGRPGPSLYITPAGPQLGTLSAYSPKIHCKGVPKSDTQQVSKICSFNASLIPLTLRDSSTGWLQRRVLMTSKGVMVTATATPLTMAATRAVSQLSGLSRCETKKHRSAATVIFHALHEGQSLLMYLGTRHPVLGGGEGRQLSS